MTFIIGLQPFKRLIAATGGGSAAAAIATVFFRIPTAPHYLMKYSGE